MNEYDSYIIANLLYNEFSIEHVHNINEADLLILNTCSVREKANSKVFSELGRWKKLKEINKNLIICVGGCVASHDKEKIFLKAPYVDLIFGPQSLYLLPEMINNLISNKKKIIDTSFDFNLKKFDYSIDNKFNLSSYITISEGCNKYCTYCIVPMVRGYERNRNFNDVISEVYNLSIRGIKEIIFLGQNVNSYSGLMDNNNYASLSLLLKYSSNISNIERISFISSNPRDFSDDIFLCYKDIPKISNHLHLPIQSGSNKILDLMKRGYSVEKYKSIINKLKLYRPNITISTDIIVGFPGETDDDFNDTLDIINFVNFDLSYVYMYSPRIGTFSYKMNNNVSELVKKYRLKIVNDLLLKKYIYITTLMIGSIQRAFVIKKISYNSYIGKTDNNRNVIFSSKKNIKYNFVNLYIKDNYGFDLIGNLI